MTIWRAGPLFFRILTFPSQEKTEKFSLKDIPPGTYNLIVWHPLGKQETAIEVRARPAKHMNILITPTSPTTYPEEALGNNPFGIDLVGDSSIVPTVELQKWEPRSESAIGGGS